MSYQENRTFSDRYIPAIKAIVGPLLLEPAPFELDTKQATDLLVLNARDMRIAARVRRHGYAERFPWDFTLRIKLANGAKTEFTKIVDGWGDWMFYGHAEERGDGISRWFVLNLDSFRAHMIRDGARETRRIKYQVRDNLDGGSSLAVFDIRDFQGNPPILVAASHDPFMDKAA